MTNYQLIAELFERYFETENRWLMTRKEYHDLLVEAGEE